MRDYKQTAPVVGCTQPPGRITLAPTYSEPQGSPLRRDVRRRTELLKGKGVLGYVYVSPSVSLVSTHPGGAWGKDSRLPSLTPAGLSTLLP